MATCRECKKEFTPKRPEATSLYHANYKGYCSNECNSVAGNRYDREVTNAGAFGRHRNPDKFD